MGCKQSQGMCDQLGITQRVGVSGSSSLIIRVLERVLEVWRIADNQVVWLGLPVLQRAWVCM